MQNYRLSSSVSFTGYFFILFLLAGCVPSQSLYHSSPYIPWRTLEKGKLDALESNKPILIDFYAGVGVECVRCNICEKTIYSDPDLAARINKDFIPVRIDKSYNPTFSEVNLVGKLSPSGECILAFLDAQGNIVTDEKGNHISTQNAMNKEEFISYLDMALMHIK